MICFSEFVTIVIMYFHLAFTPNFLSIIILFIFTFIYNIAN